jgi:HEAT repeats/Putative zinc-finger
MSCESVSKDLALYLYGELSPEDEERLEVHVHGCEACRKELDTQKRLHRALDLRRTEMPPELLADCRTDLMREIYRARAAEPVARKSWRNTLAAFWAGLGAMRQPVGALALVTLGFFAARFTARTPSGSNGSQLPPEMVVSTIRSVQPDPVSGRILISLDETRRRTMTGNVEDRNIQRLLLAAARDEANPGLRVDSIDLLKAHIDSAEVRRALLAALQHDPNSGVRLKALEGLRSMTADADTRRVLAGALLNDDNPGVRVQAIDMLMQERDESLVGVLQNVVRNEQNNYVRLKCQSALQDMNASVGTF